MRAYPPVRLKNIKRTKKKATVIKQRLQRKQRLLEKITSDRKMMDFRLCVSIEGDKKELDSKYILKVEPKAFPKRLW